MFKHEINIGDNPVCLRSLEKEIHQNYTIPQIPQVSWDKITKNIILSVDMEETQELKDEITVLVQAHNGELCQKETFVEVHAKTRYDQVAATKLIEDFDEASGLLMPKPIINGISMTLIHRNEASAYKINVRNLPNTEIDYSLYTLDQIKSDYANHTGIWPEPPSWLIEYGAF